ISSRASCTTPPRTRTCSAPSPSTRVSSRTSILRLTLCVMELSLLPEGRCVGVEGAEDAGHVRFAHPALAQRLGDRGGVGGGDRAEAAITAPVVRRAQRTAAGCGALCPSYHRGCYGCFGPVAAANTAAVAESLRECGMSEADVTRVFRTFNADAPAFRKEAELHDAQSQP